MNNKVFISILTVVAVIGLAFVYYKQGLFENETEEDAEYNVEDPKALESNEGYGVSASHPLAVKTGMEVLENGGNAADAAVAVSYALSVVEPYGSGMGGGGEMLILPADEEEPTAYQYREVAPESGAEPDSFAVPGFVKGMETINDDLGTKEMDELMQPAVDYAEDGFEADKNLVSRLKKASYRMVTDDFPAFFSEGEVIEPKDEVVQPELADSLKAVQKDGAKAFYDGELTEDILDYEESLEPEDLKSYEMKTEKAAHGEVNGYDIYGAPPPLSGITFIQSLKMAEETVDFDPSKEENKAKYIHLLGEITKQTYGDRLTSIGDAEFEDLDSMEELTSDAYVEDLVDSISKDSPSEGFELNDSVSDEEDYNNTTHFVVVDKDGTMVSTTNTLGNFFGSGNSVNGFFMNNNMENFSKKEDITNSAEPGKTSRSFTSPAIIKNDDKTIGIGSPGGKRIPIIMADVLYKYLIQDEELEDAIEADRVYVDNDDVLTEMDLEEDTEEELESMGYEVYTNDSDAEFYGGIQALIVDEESQSIYGDADKRRDGTWQVKEMEK